MQTRPTPMTIRENGCRFRSPSGWMAKLRALAVCLPLLVLPACSSLPPHATTATSSDSAQPGLCAAAQLAFSLDSGHGRFNGMSHSGTTLVLRNTGRAACILPARPLPTFTDAHRQALNIVVQASPNAHSASTQLTLLPGAIVASDMRWVSSDVYDHGRCESPAIITLAIGTHAISTHFAGHLCGPGGKPATYTLTPFRPIPATTAKTLTYTCDGSPVVQAAYPDSDTAVLTMDGKTYRLHGAISADGARYVGKGWQWWTKGMHAGRLAPLKAGETIASASGVSCTAP